ncbi:hypothetical protein [Ferroplasma acidiphilum]|uniref:Uncharacterized protein n=2 Tax=Ferroplasma TaxID=74968 RepID=S0AS05_FERAC|nr:hypothetical protein [Ferroplasma acidiphilum]AGO60900.1 hypothetical protein FACI_IFERC00001G0920 [Ferroplasma acidarmanus Fer1]MCL4349715.1 hypothetical protein [Candidatus Thermoplasmatota archaeon]
MVILNYLLLAIFMISVIVFLERSFKVKNVIKKNTGIQENIVVFKNLKELTHIILVISIAFITNSISFVILTENTLFFYIYFAFTSLLEIGLVDNFILVGHLSKKKLNPKLYIKKAHKINIYIFLSLIIYFVVYVYVVLHFFLFK